MDGIALFAGFLAAAVRVATPLLLAATGETLGERAGVINLGIEGAMLGGALAAALGALAGGPWAGVLAAALAGAAVAGVFALVAVGAGADQIITGTALTLASFGLTGALYRQLFGPAGAGLSIPTLGVIEVPVLHAVPVIGPAFFAQPAPTYLAMVAVVVLWWVLFRTRWGLAIRAVGESPVAARAAGVRVRTTRSVATIVGGALAGLGGASLVLAQVGTFAEKMTAGRGFVAIAIVVLGRWHPLGAAIAALVFGAATALQFVFQAMGLAVPYQLFLMLPYLLTLLALAGVVGRVRAPASLGRPIEETE
jgi:simple sugar transport system permease protein